MGTFSAMDIGRTGVGFARNWLDTVAHNLANVSTVRPADEEPFRARMLVARPVDDASEPGGGVRVADVVEDGGPPLQTFDPTHPFADADGYVTAPVVDLAGQMHDMMLATRTYQANLRTIETAREAYQSALRLGRGT